MEIEEEMPSGNDSNASSDDYDYSENDNYESGDDECNTHIEEINDFNDEDDISLSTRIKHCYVFNVIEEWREGGGKESADCG